MCSKEIVYLRGMNQDLESQQEQVKNRRRLATREMVQLSIHSLISQAGRIIHTVFTELPEGKWFFAAAWQIMVLVASHVACLHSNCYI